MSIMVIGNYISAPSQDMCYSCNYYICIFKQFLMVLQDQRFYSFICNECGMLYLFFYFWKAIAPPACTSGNAIYPNMVQESCENLDTAQPTYCLTEFNPITVQCLQKVFIPFDLIHMLLYDSPNSKLITFIKTNSPTNTPYHIFANVLQMK
jgi:hypothetical protein